MVRPVAFSFVRCMMGDSLKKPAKNYDILAVIAIVLAIPGFLVEICHLTGINLPIPVFAHAIAKIPKSIDLLLMLFSLGLLVVSTWWLRRQWVSHVLQWACRPVLHALAKYKCQRIGQSKSRMSAVDYAHLIEEHPRLLHMTRAEFAAACGISSWVVHYIWDHPDRIPREDLLEEICRVLMVSKKWPKGGYGDECTKQRLKWYENKRLGFGHTFKDIENLTPGNRAKILELLERKLRENLK